MESHARRSWCDYWAAKYGRRSRGYRRRIKRMPYGGSTAQVGVREEVKSHIGLILRSLGEIINLAGGSTAQVGVREEVESHIGLILRSLGEIINLAHGRGGVARVIRPFGE